MKTPMINPSNITYSYNGQVTNVVDGDTLDIKLDLGFQITYSIRCRLAQIDTPEMYSVKKNSEEYRKGAAAKVRLEELAYGKNVLIHTSKDRKGKYGRYLGRVFVPMNENESGTEYQDVANILIEEGHGKRI